MEKIPQRHSILTQTIEILRERIKSGEWETYLPGENELAQRLQVGRNTIRKALSQLTSEQVIEAGCSGRRRRILTNKPAKRKRVSPHQPVIFLTPFPPDQLPSMALRLVDEIRPLWNEAGYRLSIMSSKAFRLKHPNNLLKKLIEEHPASAWILHQTTEPMQRFFQELGIPCTILGTPHQNIFVPAITWDLVAATRHAANTLIAKGHRRICFLRAKQGLAGSELALLGFNEAFARFEDDPSYKPTVVALQSDPEQVQRSIRRLFGQAQAPTAIISEQVLIVPTIICALAQMSKQVPDEVSLISLFHDPNLDYLLPRIAHYHTNPQLEVKKTTQSVIHAIQHGAQFAPQTKLMPEFVAGASVGKPAPN